MAHEVRMNVRDEIVELQIRGTIDLEQRKALRAEVLELCREQGLRGILIDGRETHYEMSAADFFEFGDTFGELPPKLRIAAVFSSESRESDLVVSVARTRGVSIRIFDDLDDARAWLAEERE